MERLLRFESVIAICALLISAITGAAVVYQTHIIQSQYAATIWPYLDISTNAITSRHMEVVLTNDGLGPALIRSAQLFVDGHHMARWDGLTSIVQRDANGHAEFGSSAINASSTLRPGDAEKIIQVKLGSNVSPSVLLKHETVIQICYCSLNNSCWRVRTVVARVTGEYPHQVASCPIDEGIGVKLFKLY